MNIHKNARTTPYSRLLMARRVGAGERVAKVASNFCVSEQTVRKWVRRWQSGGPIALQDRSSRPARLRGTPAEHVAEIERLRRQRMSSLAIARQLGLPISTVIKILRRLGLNRLKTLDPPVPVVRYERARPRASSSIWTRRSSGASRALAIASPDAAPARLTGITLSAGSAYTSASTTPAGLLQRSSAGRTQGERLRLSGTRARLVCLQRHCG